MRKTHHLIVGGGMTADAACKGIRDFDPDGSITVVAEEPHPPYARPPLSKALWKGNEESTIWRGTEELGVELRLGRTIVSLDLEARQATDNRGETYAYERLLLDAMLGDSTLFTRSDEVETSWSLITPIHQGWESAPAPEFPNYEAGSWGPKEADKLLERDWRAWRRL